MGRNFVQALLGAQFRTTTLGGVGVGGRVDGGVGRWHGGSFGTSCVWLRIGTHAKNRCDRRANAKSSLLVLNICFNIITFIIATHMFS